MSDAQPTIRVVPTRNLLPWGVAIAVLAGLVGGGIATLGRGDGLGSDFVAAAHASNCPATRIADSTLPSVVTLSVRGGTGVGSGSGEVIRDSGYILTNDHVISAGAGAGGQITVLFSNGQSAPASIVGRAIKVDLAVLKVSTPEKLPPIPMGQSETLLVGQPVVALGAPLGLASTVTSGIVSALGRDVPLPVDNGKTALLPGAIQTDAAINPGNSGGALVDCDGRLVGVNTAIASVPGAEGQTSTGSVGIGFAIPVDFATRVADQLIANGQFSTPYFGATTVPVPPAVAQSFGVPGGLFIQAVSANGPAAQAGLQAGDVITKVDNRPTTGPDSLYLITLTKKPGDQLATEYIRDGQIHNTTVTLAAQP
jgi:putative serine protease PepD